jgi:hypothetical protein
MRENVELSSVLILCLGLYNEPTRYARKHLSLNPLFHPKLETEVLLLRHLNLLP